ncbi:MULTISPECIES: SEL1-like repeat protein [Kordiimonas]|uniref:SEL1-like repeat protein n=1 Tax=Kordiimonas TaxID=288021 RepID=UPI001FF5B98B|nr:MULTISPECIES: SEL1-like repeat protein [Kordiimonas]MCK0069585.1 SEL1-like repeat protein [Kordiimonas laminariae]UTW57050.1 sel1 repeat family protein [Kordiimonas sp. SCSIO 12603]
MGQKDRDLYDYVADRLAAAEDGRAEALYDLGLLYSTGQGVDRDYVAAHKWFNLAAERGVNRAKVDREELAHEMSRRDLVKALKQAREWLEVH